MDIDIEQTDTEAARSERYCEVGRCSALSDSPLSGDNNQPAPNAGHALVQPLLYRFLESQPMVTRFSCLLIYAR